MGEPVDGLGPVPEGAEGYGLRASPPSAHRRTRGGGKVDVGVRAINQFLSICRGQRMGIFAGSGVGKSMLMAMLARFASADVFVIGLIGERGREVQEFIQDYPGEEGMRRSGVVVATSDERPQMSRQATLQTMAVAG